MEQGFSKPNKNAANWDSDVNGNFTILERGHHFFAAVGPTTVVTGQLVSFNSSGFIVAHDPSSLGQVDGFAFQVTSPGNTAYFIARGSMGDFAAWSGQFAINDRIFPSVATPGWVTNCLDQAGLTYLGRCLSPSSGNYLLDNMPIAHHRVSDVRCGFMNAASVPTSIFSFFFPMAGNLGICETLRVRTLSCDNYRVTLYANSARSDVVYDTVVLSGNLSVRTIDMIDSALFPYRCTDAASVFVLHGAVEVLSSAATAINSDRVRVDATFLRFR